MGAQAGCPQQGGPGMRRGGDQPTWFPGQDRGPGGLPFRQVYAVGAQFPGQTPIGGDQQGETAPAAQRHQLPAQGFAPGNTIMTQDDGAAFGQGGGGRHRVRQPGGIGQQDYARQLARISRDAIEAEGQFC